MIGKFKDETAGVPIREFIGLKSKMYSLSLDNEKDSKKAKGVKKNVIRKGISHGDYLHVLNESKVLHHKMKTIQDSRFFIFALFISLTTAKIKIERRK